MADRQLQGWCADPFGLHQARYFSAGRATKLVRDGGVESYDEPPSQLYGVNEAAGPAPVAAVPPTWITGGTLPPPAVAAGPYPRDAGRYPRDAGPYPRDPESAAELQEKRRTRVFASLGAIGVIGVTAIAALILIQESPATTTAGPAQGTSLTAFVRQSAGRTLAQRSADFTLSGGVEELGQSVTISGTGTFDFSTNAMLLTSDFNVSGQTLTEKEILVGGNLYYSIGGNGVSLGQLTGGRQWIQAPVPQSGAANLAGSDPLSSLSVLEQPGITVQTLGSEVIDGVPCTGYAVTPTKQAMIAAAQAEFGSSATVSARELPLVQAMSPPTVTIWADAQGFIRQMGVNLQMTVLGSAISGDLIMRFSHFGAPVVITAPAPADVVSYQSFLQGLGGKSALRVSWA
jgi:hypothetical protein